jgi:quercetin dioxygenase-like cupin family protein
MQRCAALLRARCGFLASALAILTCWEVQAVPLRVTAAVRDVKVQSDAGPARRLAVNERVSNRATVTTGMNSRGELAFTDATAVVRLAANTRVANEERQLQLDGGALLYQSARGGNAPTITTGGIHLATGGSTGILERHGAEYVKVLVLEGTTRVYVDRVGESVLVSAGQLLLTRPGARRLPEPAHFDIAQLYRTSVFTTSGFRPLPNAAAIERAIAKQKSDPDFTRTNLVIFGRGTLVNLVEPTATPPAHVTSSASAVPPRKSATDRAFDRRN